MCVPAPGSRRACRPDVLDGGPELRELVLKAPGSTVRPGESAARGAEGALGGRCRLPQLRRFKSFKVALQRSLRGRSLPRGVWRGPSGRGAGAGAEETRQSSQPRGRAGGTPLCPADASTWSRAGRRPPRPLHLPPPFSWESHEDRTVRGLCVVPRLRGSAPHTGVVCSSLRGNARSDPLASARRGVPVGHSLRPGSPGAVRVSSLAGTAWSG